jgi:adenosylhomocysteine nucleosidase
VKFPVSSPQSVVRHSLVCFALIEEATAFRKRIGHREDVATLITGIGHENAERSLREFLKQNTPRTVFTCGFAGGLNPELKTSDVVFSTDDAALAQRLTNSGGKSANFFCVTRIVTAAAEKAELRRTTGADAVEMESGAIQSFCRERGIPCATVRVISDAAGEDLPLDFNRLAKTDLNLDYGKLTLAIVRAPGKIPALVKLQKQTRLAAEALAGVLVKLV